MKKILVIILTLIVLTLVILYGYKSANNLRNDNVLKNTDSSLSAIKAKGKIIIGTYPEITPMTFHDSLGNLSGVDIDIAKKIASQIGVSSEFREMTFPEMFKAVQDGSVDILVSSITITPEREQVMLFSIPYFDGGQVIILNKENKDIKLIEDLDNKKVGVLKETTGEKAARNILKKSQIITSSDIVELSQLLKTGKLDAVIEDLSGAAGLVKNDPTFKIIGDPFTQEYYGVVTNIKNHALIDEINGILRDIKRSGELKSITDKWLRA